MHPLVAACRWSTLVALLAAALLPLLSAGTASAAAASAVWETVTGNIAFSCGARVETWDTWLAEYVDGASTGATADFVAHSSGICPAPAAPRWEAITGDIAFPCPGVETWETWRAAYADGAATGATRDVESHASGTCPPPPAVPVPLASATFPFWPKSIAPGPASGEFAATDGASRCAVMVADRIVEAIPLCDAIAWLPGSPWVVHSDLSTPTIQGSQVVGYTAQSFAGGTPGPTVALPCANGAANRVQATTGSAVDFVCSGRLETMDLQARTVAAAVYGSSVATRSPALALIDPTGTDVAVTALNGDVTVRGIADGSLVPGTYMAGAPLAEAWSDRGDLALVNSAGGVTVWRPGVRTVSVTAAAFAYGYRLLWAPDGSRVLVLETEAVGLSAPVPSGTWVAVDGTATPFHPAIPYGDVVQALAPGGRDFWYGADPTGPASGSGSYTMYEAALPD